jgi:hypothetical protein
MLRSEDRRRLAPAEPRLDEVLLPERETLDRGMRWIFKGRTEVRDDRLTDRLPELPDEDERERVTRRGEVMDREEDRLRVLRDDRDTRGALERLRLRRDRDTELRLRRRALNKDERALRERLELLRRDVRLDLERTVRRVLRGLGRA